jgi:hypothetical protein
VAHFSRWPLALLCFGLIGAAIALDVTTDAGQRIAVACESLGIAAGGAFVYAEGARHREWWDAFRARDTPGDTPQSGQDPEGSA